MGTHEGLITEVQRAIKRAHVNAHAPSHAALKRDFALLDKLEFLCERQISLAAGAKNDAEWTAEVEATFFWRIGVILDHEGRWNEMPAPNVVGPGPGRGEPPHAVIERMLVRLPNLELHGRRPAAAQCATPEPEDPRHRVTLPAWMRRRPGADAADIAGARVGRWGLSAPLKSFYAQSNGAGIDADKDFAFLTIAEAQRFADAYFPGADSYQRQIIYGLGLWPLAGFSGVKDCDPYCVIVGDRLHGMVTRLNHDDGSWVTHGSFADFLRVVGSLTRGDWHRLHELPALGAETAADHAGELKGSGWRLVESWSSDGAQWSFADE
jgi:hypothetical protein